MKQDLGKLLLENEQISSQQLEQALELAAKTGDPIGTVLLRLGLVNEDVLKTVLELHYAVNYLNLKKNDPDLKLVGLLPWELIVEHKLVPISKEDNRLTLAMVDPSNNEGLLEAKTHLSDWQIRVVVCSDDSFEEFVRRLMPKEETPAPESFQTETVKLLPTDSGFVSIDDEPVSGANQDAAMVRLCNHILSNAIAKGCTNIHIEPAERQILVHYRKEGVLFSARKLPKAILGELITRFKNMSSAGGAEETLPYDGHLSIKHEGQNFFFRLSIVPGAYGEHLVIWLE